LTNFVHDKVVNAHGVRDKVINCSHRLSGVNFAHDKMIKY